MYWIALQPPHEEACAAWVWRALRFTPRVARVEEAVLLEVAASERLWGGRANLLRLLLKSEDETFPGDAVNASASSPPSPSSSPLTWACGATAWVALGLLRLARRGEPAPVEVPAGLPLAVLSAARAHLGTLERLGCRTWGQLRALPRAGVARRFGAPLLDALDAAWGLRTEHYDWLHLPECFDQRLELPAAATAAPELMAAAVRLLGLLRAWLQARQEGVLALELQWTLALRRQDGHALPPAQSLVVRTAQPTQDMRHLCRLVGEHLGRAPLAAPADGLRLRSLETRPWGGATAGLLPADRRTGEPLYALVERLSARLGAGEVLVPRLRRDWRPERMQDWEPASAAQQANAHADAALSPGALYPVWLLPEPLPLRVVGEVPQHGGPLRRLVRLYRVETAWWEDGGPVVRDYFIASGAQIGLVWIYRERAALSGPVRWFLQGLYA